MFAEHRPKIKELSPFDNTIVIEPANASVGSVPNKLAFPQGGYEVVNSRLARGAAESMVESAVEGLKALKIDMR